MFSTLGGYHDACGNIISIVGDVQYRGGTQITKDDIPLLLNVHTVLNTHYTGCKLKDADMLTLQLT